MVRKPMMLTWIGVPEFEEFYEVSTEGQIRRLAHKIPHWRGGLRNWPARDINPGTDRNGYRLVTLNGGGKTCSTTVHRIVAKAFIPNPENLPEVDHKDLDRGNNKADNLQWVERIQNVPRGERVAASKLTEEQVLEIRKSGLLQKELGDIYGVDPSTISRIKSREYWSHI